MIKLKINMKAQYRGANLVLCLFLVFGYLGSCCLKAQTPPAMLPHVEYEGPIQQGGVPDLRMGVALYEEYFNYKNNLPTKLKEEREDSEKLLTLLKLHEENKLGMIRYTYPIGITILYIPNEKIVLVQSQEGRYYGFSFLDLASSCAQPQGRCDKA